MLVTLVFTIQCQRNLNPEKTILSFTTPGSAKLSNSSIPQGMDFCYAVHITTTGSPAIPVNTTQCGYVHGSRSSIVAPNTEISMTQLDRGDSRTITLLGFMVNLGESCPLWSQINGSRQWHSKAYILAKKEGVSFNSESVNVSVDVEFPGLENNITNLLGTANQCSTANTQLLATLDSSGQVRSPTMIPFNTDPSNPKLSSFYKSDPETVNGDFIGVTENSGSTQDESNLFNLQPNLHSSARDPETFRLYALDSANKIVEVDPVTGKPISFSCPFAKCTIPKWAESFSIGTGSEIYFKDHQGQVHSIASSGNSQPQGTVVSPRMVKAVIE